MAIILEGVITFNYCYRLVYELYSGTTVPVSPGTECYCPISHPMFLPPPEVLPMSKLSSGGSRQVVWTGTECAATQNISYEMSNADRENELRFVYFSYYSYR